MEISLPEENPTEMVQEIYVKFTPVQEHELLGVVNLVYKKINTIFMSYHDQTPWQSYGIAGYRDPGIQSNVDIEGLFARGYSMDSISFQGVIERVKGKVEDRVCM